MGEYTQKLSLWVLGIVVSAFAFLLKFIYNLLVENSARKVELQIINKLDDFEKKLDARFTVLEKAIESNKKHNNKNSEHEIHLIQTLLQMIKNNDSNNKSN
jgi:hypothetical protein